MDDVEVYTTEFDYVIKTYLGFNDTEKSSYLKHF